VPLWLRGGLHEGKRKTVPFTANSRGKEDTYLCCREKKGERERNSTAEGGHITWGVGRQKKKRAKRQEVIRQSFKKMEGRSKNRKGGGKDRLGKKPNFLSSLGWDGAHQPKREGGSGAITEEEGGNAESFLYR